MKLEQAKTSTHHVEPHPRPRPAVSRRPTLPPSPLESLSDASGQYARAAPPLIRHRRQPSLLVAAIAAIAVGTTVSLVGGFEYLCRATFQVTAPKQSQALDELRRALADFAAQRLGNYGATAAHTRWFVDSPRPAQLSLGVVIGRRQADQRQVDRLAQDFIVGLQESAQEASSTPSEAERALGEYAERLRNRIEQAREETKRALALIPDDPQQARRAALDRWQELRDTYDQTRADAEAARQKLTRLQGLPDPTAGIVTGEERRAAWEADAVLTHDLRELTLRLSELRLELLNVWQLSAGPLERLQKATDDFVRIVSTAKLDATLADLRKPLDDLAARTSTTQSALADFVIDWTAEFKAIQTGEPDPHTSEALDAYNRLCRRLGDFAFRNEKHRTAIHDMIRGVGNFRIDDARCHVFQSELLRGFRTLQSASDGFEFATAGLAAKNNFRLEAALTGARGLRKRSQARIRNIEHRLETLAIAKAKKQRNEAIALARQERNDLHAALDDVTAEIIALQDLLNAAADENTYFVQARDRARSAEHELERLRSELARLDAKRQELEAARLAAAKAPPIKLLSCDVSERPINARQSVRSGAIAAGLTLLTVFLAQCWVARQR